MKSNKFSVVSHPRNGDNYRDIEDEVRSYISNCPNSKNLMGDGRGRTYVLEYLGGEDVGSGYTQFWLLGDVSLVFDCNYYTGEDLSRTVGVAVTIASERLDSFEKIEKDLSSIIEGPNSES